MKITIDAPDIEDFATSLAHNVERVWLASRPNVNLEELDLWEVLCLDAPITEFAHLPVIITAPILVREVFASLRNHIMWAQTSRNTDLLKEWDVFDTNMNGLAKHAVKSLRTGMLNMAADGIKQDVYRLNLPLSYMTTFSMALSWRDVLRMKSYFGNLQAADLCVQTMFSEVEAALLTIIKRTIDAMRAQGWLKASNKTREMMVRQACNSIKPQVVMHEWSPLEYGDAADAGDMVTISTPIQIGLRAQLVRHRYVHVADTLSLLINSEHNLSRFALNNVINASVTASKATWRTLIKERSCWIAQADLWATVLRVAASRVLPSNYDFEKMLPCASGICPFSEDAKLRLSGKDPGVPCPRYIKLNAPPCFTIWEEGAVAMHKEAAHANPKAREYWDGVIDDLVIGENK